MQYEVRLVEDDEMPDGRDLVIVERGPHEPAIMLISGRPAQLWQALCDWETTHDILREPTLLYAVS